MPPPSGSYRSSSSGGGSESEGGGGPFSTIGTLSSFGITCTGAVPCKRVGGASLKWIVPFSSTHL